MAKANFRPITGGNVARFVEKLNARCHKEFDTDEDWLRKYGRLYNFQYRFDDGQFVVYDAFGMLDMFSDNDLARPIIDEMCEKNGWYAEPVSCSADFTFGEA